jgi:hypothetical protein
MHKTTLGDDDGVTVGESPEKNSWLSSEAAAAQRSANEDAAGEGRKRGGGEGRGGGGG